MNSALEIMKAIVENGGPIEAWVSQNGKDWGRVKIVGFYLGSGSEPILVETKHGLGIWYKFASLTDPNKTYKPIPKEFTHDWATHRAVDANGKLHEYFVDGGKLTRTQGEWQLPPTRNANASFISQGHDPTNWENSLEERKRTTRPMTAREFAKFVEDNRGKFLYHDNGWHREFWQSRINVDAFTRVENYLYAKNVPGELDWQELPQMEAE